MPRYFFQCSCGWLGEHPIGKVDEEQVYCPRCGDEAEQVYPAPEWKLSRQFEMDHAEIFEVAWGHIGELDMEYGVP